MEHNPLTLLFRYTSHAVHPNLFKLERSKREVVRLKSLISRQSVEKG
jgi:hypothetical protein